MRKLMVLAVLVVCLVGSNSARAAYECYVGIEGAKQGKFKGESTRDRWKTKMAAIHMSYEVAVPRDAATGMATGKRVHQPLTITKEWGAATPQIFQAMITNEPLKKVTLEFIRTTADGSEEVYHTITLTNATVVKIRYTTPQPEASAAAHTQSLSTHELEEVSFSFERIEMSNMPGQTTAADEALSGGGRVLPGR